jgi:hypothetical protein
VVFLKRMCGSVLRPGILPRSGRDICGPVSGRGIPGQETLLGGEEVDLIEDLDQGDVPAPDFTEDVFDGPRSLFQGGRREVDDMEEAVGFPDLFQGGLEGGNELHGEFPDETDGVAQEEVNAIGIFDPAQDRVKCEHGDVTTVSRQSALKRVDCPVLV